MEMTDTQKRALELVGEAYDLDPLFNQLQATHVALWAAKKLRDYTPMYTGNLNPKWKAANSLVEELTLQLATWLEDENRQSGIALEQAAKLLEDRKQLEKRLKEELKEWKVI